MDALRPEQAQMTHTDLCNIIMLALCIHYTKILLIKMFHLPYISDLIPYCRMSKKMTSVKKTCTFQCNRRKLDFFVVVFFFNLNTNIILHTLRGYQNNVL